MSVPDSARVSVCMATYNGAAHVEAQLRSILEQLSPDDEVVVVDDASTDDTVARIRALRDPRVRVVESPENRGYAAAFETALAAAARELILLSDQDDVWAPGRVEVMRDALAAHSVVAGNLAVLDSGRPLRGPLGQREWRLPPTPTGRVWPVLAKLAASNLPYYGSAMGLRADFRGVVLPFPASAVELPDAWLAINGLLRRSIRHLDDVVTLRREHEGNTSGQINRPRGPSRIVRGRVLFWQMVREARRRLTS